MRSFTTIFALAAASLAIPIPAAAADDTTRYVSYTDLDLSYDAGRTTLIQRVTSAVEQVCGPIEVRKIYSGKQIMDCRSDTWEATQPQLNAVLGPTVRVLADARIAVGRAVSARRSRS